MMRSKSQRKKNRTKGASVESREASGTDIRWLLGNVALAGLISLGLLLLSSLALYFAPDPSPLVRPVGISIAMLTALIGGMITGRGRGSSAPVLGLLSGMILSLVALIVSIFARGQASGDSPMISCLLHAAFLGLSTLGGFLTRQKTGQKRKRGRRR